MTWKYILLFFLFFWLSSFSSSAQNENRCSKYTTKDGVPEGGIMSIIQDSCGFIWVAAQSGLARFDGQSFKTYRYAPNDSNSLVECNICNMYLDTKKRLWLITTNWLYLYHAVGQSFEKYSFYKFATDGLNNICGEEDGCLILAGGRGIYKFDMNQKKFSLFTHQGLMPLTIYDYHKDKSGIEWIGSEKGLIRYDSYQKRYTFMGLDSGSQNRNLILKIFPLPDSFLVAVSRYNKLLLVDRRTNKIEEFHPAGVLSNNNQDYKLFNLCVTTYNLRDSVIICSINGNLTYFNWRTKTFNTNIAVNNNYTVLATKNVSATSIYCDREGIMWYGRGDLYKEDLNDYEITKIPSVDTQNNLKRFESYNNLIKHSSGLILLEGLLGMGLYDPATDKFEKCKDSLLSHVRTSYYHEDKNHNVWCSTNKDIISFNIINGQPKIIRKFTMPGFDKPGYFITSINLDNNGHILVASSKGFYIIDTLGKTVAVFNANSKPTYELTHIGCLDIKVDHAGNFWVGTLRGINKIDSKTFKITKYKQNNKDNSYPDWHVNGIEEDKQGYIWFVTSQFGFCRLNPLNDSFAYYSAEQGLPTIWFRTLNIDGENNLWSISRMGIQKLNAVTLQNELYTQAQGFPVPQEISNFHFSNIENKLYILSQNYIYEVNTQKIEPKREFPGTFITGFSIFDNEKHVPENNQVTLNYNENFINIEFACPVMHNNKQIKFAYRMSGVDVGWVYCNSRRNAIYTQLSPGKYNFYVKAQSPDGTWGSKPTMLSIIVTPPFWQKWWFRLLEIIIASGIVIWIARLYTLRRLSSQKLDFEKIQAVSIERNRIASDMHDDLGSGLTSIRLLSEIARLKSGNDNPARPEIEKILNSASTLSDSLKEILWAMNTRFDKLDDFIIYIRTYSIGYFEESTIKFQFNLPENIPELVLHGQQRRSIFLCIKEAFHNIIKHSRATEASLSLATVENTLIINIKDNGIGITIDSPNIYGFGLNSMKERLNKLGGTIEIRPGDNGGTSITFKIKIDL